MKITSLDPDMDKDSDSNFSRNGFVYLVLTLYVKKHLFDLTPLFVESLSEGKVKCRVGVNIGYYNKLYRIVSGFCNFRF